MRPLLIKEVVDARGHVLTRNKPRVRRRVISVATARRLKQILAGVLAPEGTGSQAALALFRAAGKTGTAQQSNNGRPGYAANRRTASFVGFVPVEEPRIVVVVVINEPTKGRYGGVVAAPAFRRIASQTLHCLNVPPNATERAVDLATDRHDVPERPLALEPVTYETTDDQPTRMPDLIGLSLKAALVRLPPLPCSVDIRGSGRVVAQTPKPGRDLTGLKSCRLVLAAD
jgi:cell division protein FtsI (penicillin-binding protein 3)